MASQILVNVCVNMASQILVNVCVNMASQILVNVCVNMASQILVNVCVNMENITAGLILGLHPANARRCYYTDSAWLSLTNERKFVD